MNPWVLAARPRTLTAAVVPVAVGTAVAAQAGGVRVAPAAAALLGAVFLQIGTNFANDVFDFEKGADGSDRLGPLRVTQAGLLSPRAVRTGMWAAFALATVCGAYLALIAGWPIVAIGIASIASGIAYTGGPYPLGYHGLGDLFVLVFFGVVAVCGTVFVQTGAVPPLAVAASIPVGAIATAILVVNNLRDRESDARAGKRTLAVRFGRRFAIGEYGLLLFLAYATPALLVASGHVGWFALLPWASAPMALARMRRVARDDGAALNASLGGTARLLLVFGLLFATGLALPAPS